MQTHPSDLGRPRSTPCGQRKGGQGRARHPQVRPRRRRTGDGTGLREGPHRLRAQDGGPPGPGLNIVRIQGSFLAIGNGTTFIDTGERGAWEQSQCPWCPPPLSIPEGGRADLWLRSEALGCGVQCGD